MDLDAQTVIQAIKTYKNQIYEMDRKVKLFLSDRKRHRYPTYEEFITEIRRFENRIHNVKFGFANTEVHMRLDGLMNSLYVNEQAWKRMFQQDSDNYKRSRAAPAESDTAQAEEPEEEEKSNPLVDKVFAFAQKKWAESGVNGVESKEELGKRLLPEFQAARRKLKKGEKISVVYDSDSQQVKVAVKKTAS
jgi:hypothetical protein